MNKINNILVAVELDKESLSVMEYGITLGLMLDANVRCLHVTRPMANRIVKDESGLLVDEYDSIEQEDLHVNLEKMMSDDLEKLRSMVLTVRSKMDLDDHPISANVRSDFAVPGILAESNEIGADLIVVGAHVDFKRKDLSISNLSKEIIDRSEKSVVVVPSTYGNRNLDHMCMFINFEFNELTMIQDMIEVAMNNDVHLSFVHIMDTEEMMTKIEENIMVYRRLFLNDEDHPYISFSLKSGKISDIIDDLTNDMDVDLIGLKSQKKHWDLFGLQKTFDSEVLNHIRVPLYIWRNT